MQQYFTRSVEPSTVLQGALNSTLLQLEALFATNGVSYRFCLLLGIFLTVSMGYN